MGAVFTNLKNSKTSDLNRLRPNLWGKNKFKDVALSNQII